MKKIGKLLTVALLAASFQSNAATTEVELTQEFLNAFTNQDTQALFALYHWSGVHKESQEAIQKVIQNSFSSRQISHIYIEEIQHETDLKFHRQGVPHQLNLMPVGKFNVVYVKSDGTRVPVQEYIGLVDGNIKIAVGVPAY